MPRLLLSPPETFDSALSPFELCSCTFSVAAAGMPVVLLDSDLTSIHRIHQVGPPQYALIVGTFTWYLR